jgi:hypothetical protein
MSFTFSTKAAVAPKQPTISDAKPGSSFTTSYGTLYHVLADGSFLKLGNPKRSDANNVTVKSSSYFSGRGSEAITFVTPVISL